MLTDQKTFASYARLFMYLKGTQFQGFLDFCWEKYLKGAQSSLKWPDQAGLRFPDRDLSVAAHRRNPGKNRGRATNSIFGIPRNCR